MKEFIGCKSILLMAIPIFLVACSETTDEQPENEIVQDTVISETTNDTSTFYQVPSPNEMFVFIKEAGVTGKSSAPLNNPEHFNSYNDLRKKALNFGVYSTDLLYCSTFDLGSEVMKYFAVVKKMGDDLGVSSVITEKETEKIDNSIGDNDSLIAVANEIYYNTYNTLEQNDQGKVLAQMVAGGWIESLYLVTSMNKKFSKDSPVFQRIADQKLTLENLILYLEKYNRDSGVQETIAQFKELETVFAELGSIDKGESKVDTSQGKVILGGGSEITINADQYKRLSEKVAEIRNNITSTKA